MARPGAKNQLYGIEIWTKGSDGRHLSVVLKVQHFCDELAQLNGLAIGQWYVTFEVVSGRWPRSSLHLWLGTTNLKLKHWRGMTM